jgi:hypothetical protein
MSTADAVFSTVSVWVSRESTRGLLELYLVEDLPTGPVVAGA